MKKISFITQVIALTLAIPALSIMELKHDHAIQVKASGSVLTIETANTANNGHTAVIAGIRTGV